MLSFDFKFRLSTIKSRKPCSSTNSDFWNPSGKSLDAFQKQQVNDAMAKWLRANPDVEPDVIKQEVYLKECSRIMDISEEVLFNTLAQILQKDKRDASGFPGST